MQLEQGKIYIVVCIKILDKGALFQLQDNSIQFIHISKLANRYVKYVEEEVSVGATYTAICVYSNKFKKLELSLKVNDSFHLQRRAPLNTLDAFYLPRGDLNVKKRSKRKRNKKKGRS